MTPPPTTVSVPIGKSLFRGERRLHIALLGAHGGGKTTLFRTVQATSVQRSAMAGAQREYDQCIVQIGLDEARQLCVVADGMGGHNAGEVASGMAVETLGAFVEKSHVPVVRAWFTGMVCVRAPRDVARAGAISAPASSAIRRIRAKSITRGYALAPTTTIFGRCSTASRASAS